ncbi:hypothetical protein EMIHUDRAFT_447970 [Emiliania huxleyi CCMP1516]|uniref:Carotenoid oxygenase n=2 Tax=Emiliania huxleyi TaxID=2903 RepID=A0A0D3J3U0_EMIH1|nr:hypothetical protein EMIHUDRAFT_447970 [Emiliania huxleyi CCMP1516]EOD18175.1 hypothetical protein EMIHUDRAFT_447970 [Emiliania huxleyi CCMP1516]|eukprot:XP_005770604.1 hypothetical protein EMIHUDRAFT_447970 [Emiliania huxleyi CCMP1516]
MVALLVATLGVAPAGVARRALGGKPSAAVWNEEIKAAWTQAYASAQGVPANYDIDEIEGRIPSALRGTVFRNGPGNFERGGQRYEHVLDGDGLLCRWSLDGATGRARFASRFVRTPEYAAEEAADTVLHRNTFGTQPASGPLGELENAFDLVLKNPANTNVQSWGGKLLALWEAALPCRIDPDTLEYVGRETFDGLLPDGALTVASGIGPEVDASLGLGVAFTAHPREDRKRGRVVGWSWAAPLVGSSLSVTVHEWDAASGALLASTPTALPSAIAPHDFALTDSYIFALNAMQLNLFPYVLGLTGPRRGVDVPAGAVLVLINPTLLLETTLRLREGGASLERSYVAGGAGSACIDHPHVDPRFEGDGRVRYIFMSWCNAEGESGSPPVGYCRFDRLTGKTQVWRAPPRTFCEEVVVIPRPAEAGRASAGGEEADVADVWLAGMMYSADVGRSCLAILDGDDLESGPVCRLWLRQAVPHGLHGCFVEELYGMAT